MSSKRRHERFIRRLETEFIAQGQKYRAISSDFSLVGLFVRTNHAFAPDTLVELTVHLPNGAATKLKGRVKRAMKTPAVSVKNGMGIEIIEKDRYYTDFINSYYAEENVTGEARQEKEESLPARAGTPTPEMASASAFEIVVCANCGAKNRVSTERLSVSHRCGRCGSALIIA